MTNGKTRLHGGEFKRNLCHVKLGCHLLPVILKIISSFMLIEVKNEPYLVCYEVQNVSFLNLCLNVTTSMQSGRMLL